MKDFTLDLQKIGLSDKEAKVYLAALELGADTAQNISKRAGVNRATTYVAIKALSDLGLIGTFQKDKKQFFSAVEPARLISLYDKAKAEAEEKKILIERLRPELAKVHHQPGERTTVKYFEGKEALLSMALEFYKDMKGGTILNIFPADLIKKAFSSEDLKDLKEARIKKNVFVRGLYTSGIEELRSSTDQELRRISYDKFPLRSDIAIYGDKVRIVNLGERLSGIVIEDKNFADTLRSVFELAWTAAEQ